MAQPYVGEIRMFAGNFAPAGWMFCEGQLLPISENETLFQLIGTTYGGDGQSTFALPDLRGRIPIHQGNGFILAETGGAEEITLTVNQIAAHSHHADRGTFPPTGAMGTPPAGLVPMLPDGFEFRYGDTQYRWHLYGLPEGLPMFSGQTVLMAVEVQTPNPELAATIRGLYKGRLTFGSATNLFFVLD